MLKNEQFIEALNGLLEQEHACAIRYHTRAALIKGPYAELLSERLKRDWA